MTLTLDQLAEKYPYLNKRWIREKANEGLIPHSRPHYRLYVFNLEDFERALMKINQVSDLDRQVANEFLQVGKRKQHP